jgi:hypothetical protein
MSNSNDSALAFCLSSYASDAKVRIETETVKVRIAKPIGGSRDAKDDGSRAAPKNDLPAPKSIEANFKVGTLNGSQFLVAMRRASTRDSQIAAIASYIGYNSTQPFGEQDSAARAAAQREIRPATALAFPFSRGTVSKGGSSVAGEPDHASKHRANLEARERLAVDTMLLHEATANAATAENAKELYRGLAQVERERLVQIRADIASL